MCTLSMPSPASADITCSTVEIDAPSCSQRRRKPRIADMARIGGNGDRPRQIDAMKHDAGVGRRRPQHEIDARAGVETDARSS